MDLDLEGLKRNSFAIDADVTIALVLGNDAIGTNFLIIDMVEIEEGVILDCEQRFDGGQAREVATNADEVKAAIGGQ